MIEAHLRSTLAQLGQIDPSSKTETAGAIHDARPDIVGLDQENRSAAVRKYIGCRPAYTSRRRRGRRCPRARRQDEPMHGNAHPAAFPLRTQIHGRPTLLVPIDERVWL
jgi:hypothetical protein